MYTNRNIRRAALVLLIFGLLPATFTGCGTNQEHNIVASNPDITTTPVDSMPSGKDANVPTAALAIYSGDWTKYVLSEARYALCQNRSGSSSKFLNDQPMGDWNYTTGGSDNWAFSKVSKDYGGATGTVGMGTYGYGGWCKFFVSLVLFRSSYGLGNSNHLYLPTGYGYAGTDIANAGPGWVIQSTMPHTGIIDAPHYNASGVRDGWWIIDANWLGTWYSKDAYGRLTVPHYSYWIGKHFMSDATLRAKNFYAWKPNLMQQYF